MMKFLNQWSIKIEEIKVVRDKKKKHTYTQRQKTNKDFSKEFKMLHRWFLYIIHVNEGQMIFILVNGCNFPPYQIFYWPHC